MYDALCDLVDLMTYENIDVLAATCRLVEKIASFKENLQIMVEAGIVPLVMKLVPMVSSFLNISHTLYTTLYILINDIWCYRKTHT